MARVAATPGKSGSGGQPAKPAVSVRVPANPVRTPETPVTKRVAATPARTTSSSYSSSSGRTPATPAATASYSGGGGGYSGGGAPSSGGDFSGGGIAAPAPAPVTTLDIPDPMADATFQRQNGELARALDDFTAQQDLAKAQYENQYSQGLRRLGWDQQAGNRSGFGASLVGEGGGWSRSIPGAYGMAYDANENDFAGRGLFNSGLYAQALSDLNSDFTDRKTTMDTARADWQGTQDLNRQNLLSSQESTRQSALTDAIARIAAQYGVNLSDVTPGKTNQIAR